MILCLGTTPAAQRVMRFSGLMLDAVNRATATLDGIAGKSVNVAKVLHALGERPLATGFLGGARGEAIRTALAARGIESEFVTVAADTRECVTVIDESAGTHTELVEESAPAEPDDFARLLAIVRRRMPGCRAAVMSGTIAPGGPADLYAQCVRLAHDAGALAIVDAQGPALIAALPAGPDLVKPNRAELAATVGRELADEHAVLAAIRELAERGARRVVVTAGREPTLLFDGTQVWRIRSPRLATLNPIGSGDALTAALVWRLVRGDDLGEAGRWGSAAGAANALTWMAGEVSRADVERLAGEVGVETSQVWRDLQPVPLRNTFSG
ncbi:MAG: 1-phosphofructokinase family hexose kinase [Verrucomicrobiota bacterium]|jgi:tagatose 6-phosphate kinase